MPTKWTDRDDCEAGACPAGPVTDDEQLYRLVDTQVCPDEGIRPELFQTKYVCVPKPGPPNNACGERDGESILRRGDRPDGDLVAESNDQYAAGSRTAAGAVVALARRIRAIRNSEVLPDQQLFYVYEDPTEDKPHHAVLRYTDEAELKTYAKLARRDLIDLFERIVEPG